MTAADSFGLLAHEAQGLLSRIRQIRPFSLRIPSVPAAAVTAPVLQGIERELVRGKTTLERRVTGFLMWLERAARQGTSPEAAQQRLTWLRLQFNAITTELDLFADALTQRSEHELGTWLGGLDAMAADALALSGGFFRSPPLLCYVDRGIGAAIRRARTRLPGGGQNPVAIVRVPRERMVGTGVASSLVHEVGHQGAALLGLVESLRPVLRGLATTPATRMVWLLWDRWISEIVADLWSVARLGIAAPLGMLAVVSLPRAFVFRINVDDPHPTPWIRVKLSCVLGDALYPHPQWARLARAWESLYPLRDLPAPTHALLTAVEASIEALASLLVRHRPRALRGVALGEALADPQRRPERLERLFTRSSPARLAGLPPTLACAAIGQARVAGRLTAAREAEVLSRLLSSWALRHALPSPARAVAAVSHHAASAH